MVTLLCAIIPAAAGAAPSVIAQQEEETSLGEEDLAGSIVSDVLEDRNAEEDESNQDATNTANEDSNQGQDVDQDDISTFGDDTADLDSDNVAVPLAVPIDIDEEVVQEELPVDGGGLPPECAVEITADKEIYEPEDVVAITITNTGDVTLEFPNSLLGLEIKNLDTEEVLLLNALPEVTTLEPGESKTFQFTYERLVNEIGVGLISATVASECGTVEEVTFTLSAPPPPEEITTYYDTGLILCSNDNTPQQCDVPFRVTIETASVLKVGITVSPEHCSSTNYYVSVDGDEDTFGGTFIGRAGYSAIGDDSRTIPPYDFGTVESGSHTLDIWVEGIQGGCNQGYLSAWEGTLTVITSEPPQA
jgi:hypothetical protein